MHTRTRSTNNGTRPYVVWHWRDLENMYSPSRVLLNAQTAHKHWPEVLTQDRASRHLGVNKATMTSEGLPPSASNPGSPSHQPSASLRSGPELSGNAPGSQYVSQTPGHSYPTSNFGPSQGTPARSGFRGTSVARTPGTGSRRRVDLGNRTSRSIQYQRSLSLPPSQQQAGQNAASDTDDDDEGCLWGTRISFPRLIRRLQRFLHNFQEPDAMEPKYVALIRQMLDDDAAVLNVDCHHIYEFDRALYTHFIDHPAEVTTLLDSEVQNVAAELAGQPASDFAHILTKPNNLMTTKVIRDLDPSDIDKLVSINGMITRTSNVVPELRNACFKCQRCGREEWREEKNRRVDEPTRCPDAACGTQWSMRLMHGCSTFYDKQIVKMQENPNEIPEGETPHAVTMLCFDEMVDTATPGDRVTVTGIYKAMPLRVNPRQRTVKSVYKTHIDVLHIRRDEKAKLFSTSTERSQQHDAADPVTPGEDMTREQILEKEVELRGMAADPEIYEKLTASIAPSIWEQDDIKKGILCQLFGGDSKEVSGGKVRGEMNVLLVGDPGTSKSQLLQYAHKLAPRGMYTSGRGSSAVGLTAYVTKDPETKEMVLESGALVLSDKGVCCIDEFDKMTEATRSMLHEIMEQQTVSVAKAGVIAQLNARTSVLAAANPVGSRYNPRMSVVANLQLPPSLMSRFDLIYLLLDSPNEELDKKLARHIVSLFWEQPPAGAQEVIPPGKLKDYIAFARSTCQPQLNQEAAAKLVGNYLEMRSVGGSRKVITATPRQLESMIRISEALARMRLSDVVEAHDVDEAYRLMKEAMKQSATDPVTGNIDMDIIQTGMSSSARVARQQLATELRNLLHESADGMTMEELVEKAGQQSSVAVTRHDVLEAMKLLQEEVVREGGRYTHVLTT